MDIEAIREVMEGEGTCCQELVELGLLPPSTCGTTTHCGPDCCDPSDIIEICQGVRVYACYNARDYILEQLKLKG